MIYPVDYNHPVGVGFGDVHHLSPSVHFANVVIDEPEELYAEVTEHFKSKGYVVEDTDEKLLVSYLDKTKPSIMDHFKNFITHGFKKLEFEPHKDLTFILSLDSRKDEAGVEYNYPVFSFVGFLNYFDLSWSGGIAQCFYKTPEGLSTFMNFSDFASEKLLENRFCVETLSDLYHDCLEKHEEDKYKYAFRCDAILTADDIRKYMPWVAFNLGFMTEEEYRRNPNKKY